MDDATILKAAAAPVNDGGFHTTVAGYFKACMLAMWEETEHFGGKRPMGSSGWTCSIAKGLVQVGVIKGRIDEDGDLCDYDEKACDEVVKAVINRFVIKGEH
jgi:hypothetical protein